MKAKELSAYTIKITANPKVFKPEYQRALTERIVETALEVHMLSWSANNVLVNSVEDMQRRLDYQDRSADACNNLLSLIEVAKPVFFIWQRSALHTGAVLQSKHESFCGRGEKQTGNGTRRNSNITTVYGVKIMQIIINKGMSPKDHARLDNAQASAQRNADLIEYLAMMADVEIPTDEEEAEDE